MGGGADPIGGGAEPIGGGAERPGTVGAAGSMLFGEAVITGPRRAIGGALSSAGDS